MRWLHASRLTKLGLCLPDVGPVRDLITYQRKMCVLLYQTPRVCRVLWTRRRWCTGRVICHCWVLRCDMQHGLCVCLCLSVCLCVSVCLYLSVSVCLSCAVEHVDETTFMYLTCDLPAPPLYPDEMRENIIPQVPLFGILNKFNGLTEKEYKTYKDSTLKRFEITQLPPFIILYIKVASAALPWRLCPVAHRMCTLSHGSEAMKTDRQDNKLSRCWVSAA